VETIMHGCQGCQDLLLEYLYDLLDDPERQGLEAHLAICPICQAALPRAREQQRKLAAAARMEFPHVRFVAPPPACAREEAAAARAGAAPEGPSTLPLPARSRRVLRWQRWAAAAAVLVALTGLGGVGTWVSRDYALAHEILAGQHEAVAEAARSLAKAKGELAEVARERDEQIEKVRTEVKARELRLLVSGPRAVQSGAPAEYEVRTFDLDGAPSQALVEAHLVANANAPPQPQSGTGWNLGAFGAGGGGGEPKKEEKGAAKGGTMGGRAGAAPIVASASSGSENRSKLKLGDGDKPQTAKQPTSQEKDVEAPRRGQGQPLRVEPQRQGVYRVTIPPSLRLRPGQHLSLVVSARREGGALTELREQVELTNPVYLTHLTTDKPLYQPGETVYYRSLTVDRFSLQPAREEFRFHYTLTTPRGEVRSLLDGRNALVLSEGKNKGSEVLGPDKQPVRGVGAGQFTLDPATTPGGEYTLTVSDEGRRFPPQSRKFLVNHYQPARLQKKLDFSRPSYGPGDEVVARCSALRADAGPVAQRPVQVTVQIDDQLVDAAGQPTGQPFWLRTDDRGEVLVRFRLPKEMQRGQGSLSVGFDDGGAPEPLVRTIPIVLKRVSVEFFPEGGDLIADLPNRVYFQARTPAGKPADITGRILENGNELRGEVATLHDDKAPGVNQGMGVFEFTPRLGQKYELRIDQPLGITEMIPLPKPLEDGVVLRVEQGAVQPDEPIRVRVMSTRPRNLLVGAYCRGRLLDSVLVPPDANEVVLRPMSGVGGVCRVTVFEERATDGVRRELRPLAERLLYRHPRERLDVSISADKRRYLPGQKARLALATTNEREWLEPSLMMVAVVDKSVLSLADEKTARSMPTHFLLTTEVRHAEDLEYADFFLGEQPRAAQALDLLLGTQGWRRFAEQNPEDFRRRSNEEADRMGGEDGRRTLEESERLLLMLGQSTPRTTDFDRQKIDKAWDAYAVRAEKLEEEYQQAGEVVQRAADQPGYQAAARRVQFYHRLTEQVVEIGGSLLAGVWVILAGLLVASGLRRGGRRGVLHFAGALACGALLVVSLRVSTWQWPAPGGLTDQNGADVRVTEQPGADDFAERELMDLPTVLGVDQGRPAEPLMFARGEKAAPAGPALPPGAAPPPPAGAVPPPPATAPVPTAGLASKATNGTGEATYAATMLKRMTERDQFAYREAAKDLRADGERGARAKEDTPRKHVTRAPEANLEMKEVKPAEKPAGGLGMRAGLDGLARRPPDLAGKVRGEQPPPAPLLVREYAHRHQAGKEGLREDFTETLYWHPVLVLPQGRAQVEFDLNDSVSTFQVLAAAHSLDGRLGSGVARLEVRQPLTLQPKLPLEVTASDRIDVPVRVAAQTGQAETVQLTVKQHESLILEKGELEQKLDVAPDTPARQMLYFRAARSEGTATLGLEGRTDRGAVDAIRESFKIVPEGFPVQGSRSDLLEGSASHVLELPARWVPGTLRVGVDVYPSSLADLQKGLESLLREPHGCFEQASTSNYPNLLILDYLKETRQARPEVERRARELLASGYQKLTSYECQDAASRQKRGYEWFGGTAPPHEALTAYGLLQFQDLARVQDVDPAMLKRTRDFLLGQRDGKGGFLRNSKAIDSFGRAPADITDAYIVWALTQSSPEADLTTELNALALQAKDSRDPYFLSLVALSLGNRGRGPESLALLRTVAGLQTKEGCLEGTRTSITGSRGRDLQIETTALALLGWLKTNPGEFGPAIDRAVRWISQQRSGTGGFGSTQSTILALKGLLAHTRLKKRTVAEGEVRLYLGEKQVARRHFPAGVSEPIVVNWPEAEKHLKPGRNRLRVELAGGNVLPHTLHWSYNALKPESAAGCPLRLTTTLGRSTLDEGEVVRLKVRVENVSGQGQGMAVAVVGLPAGLTLPEDLKQLKELARLPEAGKRPVLGAFEVQGRELVLYWRDLAPEEVVTVPLDLVARVPGTYRGPASRAWLYYNADHKCWVEPLEVSIKPRS
jgi:hypothetical protein